MPRPSHSPFHFTLNPSSSHSSFIIIHSSSSSQSLTVPRCSSPFLTLAVLQSLVVPHTRRSSPFIIPDSCDLSATSRGVGHPNGNPIKSSDLSTFIATHEGQVGNGGAIILD
ncbi:hypothetical protein L484_025720 [Morus notabilis]|uniref:Uncharacterized protein n=1 Tax=Morus notabilis TaxID=981085 RepID=W9REB2_9ROSA|nr:hypothetical protein L484_025720 [Morus notabilis]